MDFKKLKKTIIRRFLFIFLFLGLITEGLFFKFYHLSNSSDDNKIDNHSISINKNIFKPEYWYKNKELDEALSKSLSLNNNTIYLNHKLFKALTEKFFHEQFKDLKINYSFQFDFQDKNKDPNIKRTKIKIIFIDLAQNQEYKKEVTLFYNFSLNNKIDFQKLFN